MSDRPSSVGALLSIQLLSVLSFYLVIGQFSFSLFFIGHHTRSKFTGTDQKGPYYRIRPDCAGDAQLYQLLILLL